MLAALLCYMEKQCKHMPENEQLIRLTYTKNAKINVYMCNNIGWHILYIYFVSGAKNACSILFSVDRASGYNSCKLPT
jgi:hypothetical protein